MQPIYLHPTAAYIPNHGASAPPAPIGASDRAYLRDLAAQVAAAASRERYRRAETLWRRHNRLEKTRPMYAVYPEVGWADLVPVGNLKLENPFWRNYEWHLLHLLFRDRFLDDDFVIKPEIICTVVDCAMQHGDMGFPDTGVDQVETTGSYVGHPRLVDYRDLRNFRFPELTVNFKAAAERYDRVRDVFEGILTVRQSICSNFQANQPGYAAGLRGVQQLMLDMYDAPEQLHQLMELLTQAYIRMFRDLEATGLLTANTANHYVDSGGLGFTDELPTKETGSNLSDLWGFGVAQEYSDVSPEMHDEFGFQYQARVLEMFGINSYGCCEPYTHKFDLLLKRIPRLRRVSVSPWCDLRVAADRLRDRIIFSWKPNPSVILMEPDFERVKQYVRETLNIARDCVVEVFLKDIISLAGRQPRVTEFCEFLRSETDL